jgi:hypothetical protein
MMKRFLFSAVLVVAVLAGALSAGNYPITSWPDLLRPGEVVRWEQFSAILLDVINKGVPNQASFTASVFPLISAGALSAGTVVTASTTTGGIIIAAANATATLGVLSADVGAGGTAYIAYGGLADVLVTNGATASYYLLTSATKAGSCDSAATIEPTDLPRLVGICVESVASATGAACQAVIGAMQ